MSKEHWTARYNLHAHLGLSACSNGLHRDYKGPKWSWYQWCNRQYTPFSEPHCWQPLWSFSEKEGLTVRADSSSPVIHFHRTWELEAGTGASDGNMCVLGSSMSRRTAQTLHINITSASNLSFIVMYFILSKVTAVATEMRPQTSGTWAYPTLQSEEYRQMRSRQESRLMQSQESWSAPRRWKAWVCSFAFH